MAATTAAVMGIVGGVASAAMSFSEAEKQKNRAADAQTKQDELMKKATAQTEIDRYSKLSVPMEVYRQRQEGSAQDIKTVMDMVTQGDQRNIASLTPGLTAQVTQGRQQTTAEMGQDMFALDKMKADAKTRQDDTLIGMYTDMSRDKAMEKQDADILRAQNISSGIQGVTSALQAGASIAPLYGKSSDTKRAVKLADKFGKTEGLQGKSRGELIDYFSGIDKDLYKQYMGEDFDMDQLETGTFDFTTGMQK